MTTVHHAPAGTDHTVIGAASGPLGQYRAAPDEAFFASPTRTLLAEGVHARAVQDERPLPVRVAETLARARRDGVRQPLVMGAVAFDHDSGAELAVPAGLRVCGALRDDPLIALPAPAAEPVEWRVRPVPEPEVYGAGVAEAVRRVS